MRAKLSRPAKPDSAGIDKSTRCRLIHKGWSSGAVVVSTRTPSAGASSISAKRRSRCAIVGKPGLLTPRCRGDASRECRSCLENLLDPGMRPVQRFLRLRLIDQRRLDRRAHRVAEGRVLRHARPPVDVGILLERLERGLDEIGALRLYSLHEVRGLPQRGAIDSGA